MSKRNLKRPKTQCVVCTVKVRQIGKHMYQKHEGAQWTPPSQV